MSLLALVRCRRRLLNSKQDLHGFFRRGNRACDSVNAAAPSICAKVDLARRFDCPCHRTPEYPLANRTRLAHLGVVARYRKEQQKRRPQPVGIFLPTDHLDESGELSAVVRWVDLAARLPRRPALPRHRFHLPNRFHRIRRHAREELLPCPGLSDVICRGWRCFRDDFRPALALAQTAHSVARRRVNGRLRTGRSSHLVPGEIARLYARDSFRGPTNGNVAYCGITPTLCRPIRLGGDGALGRAGLRQLACE